MSHWTPHRLFFYCCEDTRITTVHLSRPEQALNSVSNARCKSQPSVLLCSGWRQSYSHTECEITVIFPLPCFCAVTHGDIILTGSAGGRAPTVRVREGSGLHEATGASSWAAECAWLRPSNPVAASSLQIGSSLITSILTFTCLPLQWLENWQI